MLSTPVTQALDAAGVSYSVRPHSCAVFTTEEAARERGVRVGQIVKVMIAQKGDGALLAVLIPGDRRLDLGKLRAALADSRIRLADKAHIQSAAGLTVGAISPVELMGKMPLYIDRRVLEEEEISISAGVPEAGLVLPSGDLVRFLAGTLGDFAKGDSLG